MKFTDPENVLKSDLGIMIRKDDLSRFVLAKKICSLSDYKTSVLYFGRTEDDNKVIIISSMMMIFDNRLKL